jgi:hypothetical protein
MRNNLQHMKMMLHRWIDCMLLLAYGLGIFHTYSYTGSLKLWPDFLIRWTIKKWLYH